MSTQTSTYEQQAIDFLTATNTKFKATYKKTGRYFSDDKKPRDIYTITLKNANGQYTFTFGQSYNDSNLGKTPPTAYDVLACITKSDPGSFDDFCDEYGYTNQYDAVVKEWKNISRIFTEEQIEQLQDIQ